MREWLEPRLINLWSRRGGGALLLYPLSLLYRLLVSLRRRAYRRGWRVSEHPGVPVIVIGNIYVGGTGKTPLTLALLSRLKAAGYQPGVISRGYAAERADRPRLVGLDDSAAEVGDEPLLIAQRSDCPVVVGRDRLAAARLLRQRAPVDVIVSDDGLQHYRLQRDIEIAVIDAKRRHGNGWLLPAGPLRESVSRLSEVDAVVCNGPTQELHEYSMRLKILAIEHLCRTESYPPAVFFAKHAERDWQALAAIGHPQRFFELLKTHGTLKSCRSFADHHRFTLADLPLASGALTFVTEKDAVKIRPLLQDQPEADIWQVTVEAELDPAFESHVLGRLLQHQSSEARP